MTADPFQGLQEHYAPLGRFAYVLTRDPDVARDLAHEALVRAAQAGFNLDSPGAKAYLRATVVNLWKRSFRRAATEARALARLGRPIAARGSEEAADDRDLIWRELRRLRYEVRVCLVLRYYQELSLAEIADELGVPLGTVKSRINRGLGQLAARLGDEE